MLRHLLFLLCILSLVGCGTIQETNNQVSASYVGDQDSYQFDNLIVSMNDKDNKIMNLNVVFSVIVNPEESLISSITYSELKGIIRRLETRIKSQIVQELLSLNPAVVTNHQKLHDTLLEKAQAVFDEEYKKWNKSSYFKTEVVITSLYFTDLSVGQEIVYRRWW